MGTVQPQCCDAARLEHGPEKWAPVFRQDHAQKKDAWGPNNEVGSDPTRRARARCQIGRASCSPLGDDRACPENAARFFQTSPGAKERGVGPEQQVGIAPYAARPSTL